MFTGAHCGIGVITITTFPTLYVNETSTRIEVFARPSGYITVTPQSQSNQLVFNPPRVRIDYPYSSAQFTITAFVSGHYDIDYQVDGVNEFGFEQPLNNKVHVRNGRIPLLIDMDLEHFTNITCSNSVAISNEVSLASTCGNNSTDLFGFVSVTTDEWKIPLTMTGLSGQMLENFNTDGVLNPIMKTSNFLHTQEINDCQQHCLNSTSSLKQQITYAVQSNFFQTSYVKEISKILPYWLEIYNLYSSPEYSPEQLLTKLLTGDNVKSSNYSIPFWIKSIFFQQNRQAIYNVYNSNSPTEIKIMSRQFYTTQTSRLLYFIHLDSPSHRLDLFSEVPFVLVSSSDASPHHIVEKLETTCISMQTNDIGDGSMQQVNVDFKLRMKSFDGIFDVKSLTKWENSEKVSLRILYLSFRFTRAYGLIRKR